MRLHVNLLVKGEIKRYRTKVKKKKAKEMGGFLNFKSNAYCGPYIFQVINIMALQFLKFQNKVNFSPKLYFHYFQVPGLRGEKESSNSYSR